MKSGPQYVGKQAPGVMIRCIGGPLAGKCIHIPSLDSSFEIHPEDNFGRPGSVAAALRQTHRYILKQAVTLDGVPHYRYGGVKP